ncbi:hypothetical protein HLB32_07965 [Streptomyces cacaoi]|nr:hypothetical protein [Streptomyces cacaoi]
MRGPGRWSARTGPGRPGRPGRLGNPVRPMRPVRPVHPVRPVDPVRPVRTVIGAVPLRAVRGDPCVCDESRGDSSLHGARRTAVPKGVGGVRARVRVGCNLRRGGPEGRSSLPARSPQGHTGSILPAFGQISCTCGREAAPSTGARSPNAGP